MEILKRSYFQREQNKAQAFPQNWNFSKYLNSLVWFGLVWFGMVWYGLVFGGGQMTSEFIHEKISIMDYNGLS